MTLVGVAGRDDEAPMQDFIDRHDLADVDHVSDQSGDVWESFGVVSQPAWAFIDDTGEYEVVYGGLGEDELAQRVADLGS